MAGLRLLDQQGRAAARPGASEPEIVARVLRGEGAAIDQFVREYGAVMLAEIHRRLPRVSRQGEAEDILQTTLLEVFRDDARLLRGWRPELGRSLRNYLRMLARYRALSAGRSAPDEPLDSGVIERLAEGVLDLPASPDAWLHVEAMLEQYRAAHPEEWRFFQRCFLEEATIAELAEEFQLTPAATHQRRHRLRARLWKLLMDPSA